MKQILLVLLSTAWCLASWAQGTIRFANFDASVGLDAPVFLSDGVTPVAGAQFMAELLGGPSAAQMVSIATTGFFTGTQAGYFDGGVQTVTGVTSGQPAFFVVRVWNTGFGPTFREAELAAAAHGSSDAWGATLPFMATPGGVGSSAGVLTGLTSFSLVTYVPEPNASALGGLSVGVLAMSRATRGRNRQPRQSGDVSAATALQIIARRTDPLADQLADSSPLIYD